MKRRLIQLVVFLIVGAVINLVVAWSIAWQGYPRWNAANGRLESVTHGRFEVTQVRAPGRFFATQTVWTNPDVIFRPTHRVSEEEFHAMLPAWSTFRQHDSPLEHEIEPPFPRAFDPYVEVGSGWPMLSVHGSYALATTDYLLLTQEVAVSKGVIPIAGEKKRRWYFAGFPYLPIWPGFLVNTLLYTALAWLLPAAPFQLRRWRRRRRGLCPRCAYPIGASPVCTECGAPLPPRPDRAQAADPVCTRPDRRRRYHFATHAPPSHCGADRHEQDSSHEGPQGRQCRDLQEDLSEARRA